MLRAQLAAAMRIDRRAARPLLLVAALAGTLLAGAAVAAAADAPLPQKTLAECVAIALEHHPTLKAATATIDAAHQRVWQAASPYLPQLDLSATRVYEQQSAGSAIGVPTGGQGTNLQRFYFNTATASFSQLLFDFGQTLAAIRSAQASERSAEANRTTTRDGLILNVQQSYFNVLATRRLLDVADQTVRQTTKQLEQARGRHEVGVAPKFDVTTAEVQVANAELNQLTARNNVAVARETMRNALGMNGPLDFDLVDVLETEPIHLTEDEAVDIAYKHRPELISQYEQTTAQEDQITSLQRQYLPTLTANGDYEWRGPDTDLEETWSVGAAINFSILNGGLTAAQIGEARANLMVLKFNTDALRQNIALEVRQSVLNLEQAAQSIAVARKGAQQARESLALAEGRYTTGVGNIIELTNAQVSQTSADASYVQALYGYQTAVATVEKAVGRPVAFLH